MKRKTTSADGRKRQQYAEATKVKDLQPCRDKTQTSGPNGDCLKCLASPGKACKDGWRI